MRLRTLPISASLASLLLLSVVPGLAASTSDGFRKQVEADWLLQEKYRCQPPPRAMTTQADASGGCDGVKDGTWGFHTSHIASPWWQVDLGRSQPIARIVIWNRCDKGMAGRNDRLMVRLSDDSKEWRTVYTHAEPTFYGFIDNRPLAVTLTGQLGRFVRIQLPGTDYLHLDEVEVFGPADPARNLALHRPADQISLSPWSKDHRPSPQVDWARRVGETLAVCRRFVRELKESGVDVAGQREALERIARELKATPVEKVGEALYVQARWVQRELTLANPLLDFGAILFCKRVPGSYSHMSDQYYGWWSRPGGGLFILRGFREDSPTAECISESFKEPGSFLRPSLSFDGRKVLFAWCRHYPTLAAEPNKLNKANVPEDAFYHVFEMRIDGSGLRQLTRGKYDDFDARYLPDGRIVFLSTRRGQATQVRQEDAVRTLSIVDQPDCYVRCGGGPERPVAVYTLHTMNADGGDLLAISPFEMFEWTPSVANDGTILYSRWDYVDRTNNPFMSLWAINPDGTNARLVYKNYTRAPHCTFEPQSTPGSNKIIFTASAHHAQTMGSLVLLDPAISTEGTAPITRLTPEVCFPEIEGWSPAYFTSPWPLSERHYLVAWGVELNVHEGNTRIANGMGIYLFDAAGGLELLHRDPSITSESPLPIRPRPQPPMLVNRVVRDGPAEGRFLVSDVTHGLKTVRRGDVKALRIVAVPPKTHPTMNSPNLGVTAEDPGKCVLGTVPVESDGSAYFHMPAGVTVFFQALDARGVAVQTMRSATHVQPGQTLSCIGCHEHRSLAPPPKRTAAVTRAPSKITVGPSGSWPLRFDRLVRPVLEKHCVGCHYPQGTDPKAARFNLTAEKAYGSLTTFGKPSLADHMKTRNWEGFSIEGAGAAATSPVMARLTDPKGHHDVKLSAEDLERLLTWLDTYGQRLGSFSDAQERELLDLRHRHADLLIEREPTKTARR